MTPEQKVIELGIELSNASAPAARYANCVLVNDLLYISGKGPQLLNGICSKGRLGKEFTTSEGYAIARSVGVELLNVLKSELGSLNRVKQIVEIQGFINAVPEFEEHAQVLNGLSDLLIDVFGPEGRHARSVFGASSLRDGLPVIARGVVQIR
jgi:enamine deaminase RidA (YjgF/YER057c/UK114 family)